MGRHRASRRARAAAITLAVGLVAAACSGSGDEERAAGPTPAPSPTAAQEVESTPTEAPAATPAPVPTPAAPGLTPAVEVPSFPGDDEVLPFDDEVRTGVLDNGLTYYIRRNTAPGGRAELRLAVDAGSSSEDDDQSGVAHFLEHMLFNGTTAYPANELISILESFGSEFGPDVNAYTSYDETVYQLSVPTDDGELFDLALGVLREWASEATVDPDEVVAERGVILEEWRLRDQGLGSRVFDVYGDLLTAGTSLEGREPIGERDAIEAMTEEPLRRFYEDWYRPDLMAVIVVGDVDVDSVEAAIADRFDGLGGPDDPRPPPVDEIDDAATFAYRRLADPELPGAFIELVLPGPGGPVVTAGDYRRAMGVDLASTIIDERFADDVTRGDAAFLDAGTSVTPLARGMATPGLIAQAEPAALLDSFEALLVELRRVRDGGFTEAELDRAVAARLAEVEQTYAGRSTRQDVDYAAEYVDHHLGGEASLSWDDWIELERSLLQDMTTTYVQAAYLASIAGRAPQVVVLGPEDDIGVLPDETQVRELYAEVSAAGVAERTDSTAAVDRLMDAPEPAEIVERRTIGPLDSTRLDFANGVTVFLKQTTISDEAFFVDGVSPGGRSLLADAEIAAAAVLPDVIGSSGLGAVDQVALDRLLADRIAGAGVGLAETTEQITGGGSSDDAELVLQLIHLLITGANATDAALRTVVGELRPFADAPEELPFLAGTVALLEARYGDDQRWAPLPTVEDLDDLTPAAILDVHQRAFGDSAGSAFAIVGDFELDAMVDLAARYLGTLPSDGEPDGFRDLQPPPPEGITERRIAVGQDAQGEVTMLYTAAFDVDQATEIELAALENVFGIRLRDRLREALGATYSPSVSIAAADEPIRLVETFVEVGGDPDGLDAIVAEVDAIVADLVAGGIDPTEAATASEQVRRDNELVTNAFWAERLHRTYLYPDETPLTVPERIAVAAAIDADRLNELAAAVLSANEYIVVLRGPAES
ncbi:MAG: insulinase family protein [Actinomycetota bacterium]